MTKYYRAREGRIVSRGSVNDVENQWVITDLTVFKVLFGV